MLAQETLTGGVLFFLSREHAKTFFALKDDQQLVEFMRELIDSDTDVPRVATAGYWETLHRCLSDGTLDPNGGKPPLNHCVLGGRQMYDGNDRVVSLVRPDIVPQVATALSEVNEGWFRDRFESTAAAAGNDPFDQETCADAYDLIESMRRLFEIAAEQNGAVVFTAAL